MVRGLVLVQLVAGEEKQALSKISKIKGVKSVDGVFGSWDAIVEVEAQGIEDLAKFICGKIRKIEGVANTETLIRVSL